MQSSSPEERPINEFPQGSEVVIQHVCGCDRSRGRLCAMGLTPGTKVTIVSKGNGTCRVRVRESDLALGHRLAEHTLAVPFESLADGMDADDDPTTMSRFLDTCRRCWKEHRGGRGGPGGHRARRGQGRHE